MAGGALLAAGCGTQRITVPILPPLIPPPASRVFWSEPFDALDASTWRTIAVKGATRYEAVELEGRRCVRAVSERGASILLAQVRFDPEEYEWLSWEWRVDEPVSGEALERKDGSDASARVYVYFESPGLPWQKRSLDYVWSAALPLGALLSSAFSSQSRILVTESGAASLGRWRAVRRNLEEDFERAFGKQDLPDVVAIGLMTDTDNTGSRAVAYFDEIRVSR
jgi:hypothetical protein